LHQGELLGRTLLIAWKMRGAGDQSLTQAIVQARGQIRSLFGSLNKVGEKSMWGRQTAC